MELGTDLKIVVKAVGMVAENIAVDLETGLGVSEHGLDFSLADIQQFFQEEIDLFIRYAYCSKDTSCDKLNLAIHPK